MRLYLEVTVARAIRGAEVNGVALPTYWYQMPRVLAIIRPGRVSRPASRDLFSTFPPFFNMASARNIWKLNENKPIQLYTLYTIYRTTPYIVEVSGVPACFHQNFLHRNASDACDLLSDLDDHRRRTVSLKRLSLGGTMN